MNIKKISVAIGLLFLCKTSTTHGSDKVDIFGLPAHEAVRYCLSNPEKPFELPLPSEVPIHMIMISKTGIKAAGGTARAEETPHQTVLRAFSVNKPQIVGGELIIQCRDVNMGGSCFGKRVISIGANTYNISPFTVWGTNGNTVLTFQDQNSLITSLTFPRSTITAEYNNETVHLGSIWGTFDGVPSDTEQTIYLIGYPSVAVVINIEALKGLLSK